MKRLIPLITALIILSSFTNERQITIFTIGDSTMADKDTSGGKLERGWGMMLQDYFEAPVKVENHAVNGRSTKSFINEGRWQRVIDRVKPGDYVIIQFGHNDEKTNKPEVGTYVGGDFDANLRRFAVETKAKGGIPILMNSVVRRKFDAAADTLIDTHGDYLLPPMKIAAETGSLFIDANRITHDLEQGLGQEGSRRLHMYFLPGEEPRYADGKKDNTHYNIQGARAVAGLLGRAIAREAPELRPFFNGKTITIVF